MLTSILSVLIFVSSAVAVEIPGSAGIESLTFLPQELEINKDFDLTGPPNLTLNVGVGYDRRELTDDLALMEWSKDKKYDNYHYLIRPKYNSLFLIPKLSNNSEADSFQFDTDLKITLNDEDTFDWEMNRDIVCDANQQCNLFSYTPSYGIVNWPRQNENILKDAKGATNQISVSFVESLVSDDSGSDGKVQDCASGQLSYDTNQNLRIQGDDKDGDFVFALTYQVKATHRCFDKKGAADAMILLVQRAAADLKTAPSRPLNISNEVVSFVDKFTTLGSLDSDSKALKAAKETYFNPVLNSVLKKLSPAEQVAAKVLLSK